MVDLSRYSHRIGLDGHVVSWFEQVVARGRDAAFVDTCYLRALLDTGDQGHEAARVHFDGASANLYTTSLVLAEIARQIAKHKVADYRLKARMFGECGELLIDTGRVFVCSPDHEAMIGAYQLMQNLRDELDHKLDLCDALSMFVLGYAQHNRVFGFDRHFRAVGGMVEP